MGRKLSDSTKKETGERIKAALKAANLSQTKLAKMVDVTDKHISSVVNGIDAASQALLIKISKVLGVSVSFLMGEEQDARLTLVDPSTQIRIPLLDMNTTACAGTGNGLDYADFAISETILVDREGLGTIDPHRLPFAMLVDGTSMEGALVPDGSTLVINPAEEVRFGDVALICYHGNRSVKWVVYKPDGTIELHSSGTPTIYLSREEAENPDWFRVVGKVMKIRTEHEPRKFI